MGLREWRNDYASPCTREMTISVSAEAPLSCSNNSRNVFFMINSKAASQSSWSIEHVGTRLVLKKIGHNISLY
jgi:hypothetical protein